MKAVLQLTVELDYNLIANEENLEALRAFTSLESIDDIRNHHFQTIARKMTASVDGVYGVEYGIDGQFIPPALEEAEGEPAEWKQAVEAPPESEEENSWLKVFEDEEAVEAIEVKDAVSDRAYDAANQLNEDIYNVVTEGQPIRIVVNAEMAKAIEKIYGNTEFFEGFPIEQSDMEDFYYIVYEEYDSKIEYHHYPRHN